jgi:hypothetical protein
VTIATFFYADGEILMEIAQNSPHEEQGFSMLCVLPVVIETSFLKKTLDFDPKERILVLPTDGCGGVWTTS